MKFEAKSQWCIGLLAMLALGSEGSAPYVQPIQKAGKQLIKGARIIVPVEEIEERDTRKFPGDVKWTNKEEIEKFLPVGAKMDKDGRPVGYRNLFLENIAKKTFQRYLTKANNPQIFGRQLLRDPLPVHKGVHFSKKDTAFALDLKTRQMKIHGLSNLQMDYLRVIQHMGMKDAKVMARLRTDITLTGLYTMKGEVLNFIPINGNGKFTIKLKDCQFLSRLYAASPSENEKAIVKELQAQVTYDKVTFDFENLLGGGAAGSTAHMVLNTFGEAFVEAQKVTLLAEMKTGFHQVISDII